MSRRIRVGAIALAVVAGTIATAGPAQAADPLLSQGKPVTVSSSGWCCPAANAVDGNTGTRWASASGVDPQWIYVDLGAAVHVSRVRLQWDASCATAYQVDTSADRVTWTKIYATTAGKGGVEDLTSLDGTGRYVRVYGTKRCRADTSRGYSLQEFGVYGSAGDVVPPSPPGTPTLVGVTSSSATISWTAATDDVGVTGYDVYRDGQLCASTTGALTASCGNLGPNGNYGFYVNARDAAGNVSQASGTLAVKTPPSDDHTPPSTPSGLRTTAVNSTSIGLAWTASTDDVGVTGYRIYDSGTQIGTSDTTSTTLGGLTPDTAYRLQVRAVDRNGNLSEPSTPVLAVRTAGGAACTPAQGVCGATQITTDDDVVWGLTTLPDGTILYSQRDVHVIVHLDPATGVKKTVGTVPDVDDTDGEGGLLGLEINPASFATDHWLYLFHTTPSDNRIVRVQYDPAADALVAGTEQVLLTGIARNKYHNGGRLRFSPDGRYLFAATGDAQNTATAQNTSSLNGKVLRISPDGSIPADNPFRNAVWSYGHRNVQGLAFDSRGNLWEQEFGNNVMDETNLIVKGGNYGWPACEGTTGSCDGSVVPKRTYPVAQGSCSGIAIVGDALYVACERGARLYREVISGDTLTDSRAFFTGTYGRLRTVEPAPGSQLWLATSLDGDKDGIPHNSHNQILRVSVG